MNETRNDNYHQAKRILDYIFIVTLNTSTTLGQIVATRPFAMGAYMSTLTNISWLQRLYVKANLDDSNSLDPQPYESLEEVAADLEGCLEKMEQTNFAYLWNEDSKLPKRVFDLMLDNIYSGTYECISMIESDMYVTGASDDAEPEVN